MSLTWTTPAWMWPLLLVLAAGAVIWTMIIYGRTRPVPRAGLGRVLVVLRSVALVLLVAAVAGPIVSMLHRKADPGRLVVVLEDSGSMAIPDAGPWSGEGEEPANRWDASLAFVADVDSALRSLDWAGQTVFLRGNGLGPLQEFRLDDPVIPAPASHGTDLNRLLHQVADYTVGLPTRGMILVSDGQETRGTGPSGRAEGGSGAAESSGARQGTAPLFVMGAGDPVGSVDRLIKDLRYPDTAYAGDEIVVDLAVTHRFLEGAALPPVTVVLSEGGTTIVEKTFALERETTQLEIPFRAPEEGMRIIDLQVSALDNERFLANNKVSLAINVRRGRSRVLVLADQPGWDVRFLAQAALAEPRIELSVVYPSARGPVFADSLVSWVEPAGIEEWDRWDALVLVGWQGVAAALDWPSVQQAVKNGMGLLVLPGTQAPGQRFVAAPPEGLAQLLPVTATQFRWLEGSFFGSIPIGNSGHPVLNLVDGSHRAGDFGGKAEQDLASLPPLRRILGVVPRPGALELVDGVQKEGRGEDRLPLLVLNTLEMGRTVWFGGQRLWELAFWEPGTATAASTGASTQVARRLLQNLLVWLAAGQDESGLVFAGRRAFYQEGERITLGAQWRDMRGQPVLDRSLALILRAQDASGAELEEQSFALRNNPDQPGLAEVDLPPLPPGNYSIQLTGQGDPPVLGTEEFLVVSAHSIEETQVRQDTRRLMQLAGQANGSYLPLGSETTLEVLINKLAAIDWSGSFQERRARLDFWSGWPFLILVAGLLSVEWFLRRRNGLL